MLATNSTRLKMEQCILFNSSSAFVSETRACIILVNLNFKQEFHITLNFILK